MFRGLRKRLHRKIMFVGVAVIIAGIIAGSIIDNFNKTAVETGASIVAIEEKSGLLHKNKVTVSYRDDNGKEYESELGYYEDDMKEGQSVLIKYDPENPEKIRPVDGPDTEKIIYAIGGVIFAYGFIGNIIIDRNERKRADKRAEKRLEEKNSEENKRK